jgi:hypothetical protein
MDDFLNDLARFAVPGGVAAGVGVVASYQFALNALKLPLIESRTVAITALILVGLFLVLALEGIAYRRGKFIILLCTAMLVTYLVALLLPFTRDFFQLAEPTFTILASGFIGACVAIAGLLISGFPPGQATMLEGEHIEESE